MFERLLSSTAAFLLLTVAPPVAAVTVVVLEPAQDNSLYETAPDTEDTVNERSNGAGSFLFAGRTGFDAGFKRRRALLRFDLSAIPSGSVIHSVELSLYQSKAAPGSPPADMGVHRVEQAWGEAGSDAIGPEGQGDFPALGDATWHRRFYPIVNWDTPGGTWAASASAVTTVGQTNGRYSWACTSALLDDVRHWHDQPGANFGWIVIGGEEGGQSAHRFNSREHSETAERPQLRLVYSTAEEVFSDGFETRPSCD
ncbi:DNRLRE domain-containing protein [Elongatibacter sediminis]|uniref:DNRLRE domain-containing protein n=1 Tax=Elongatibacter sediminis TaxID=3119006 RepID=A0AAW9RHJ6_9GAMM